MVSVERRLAALEARLARLRPLPTTIDGLDLNELSHLAVDVLETITREWPDDHLPAGLCAAVVAACDRPAADRVMALGMALAGHWGGDPLPVMAALVSSGLLPGAAGDHGALR